jgi:hypothetical protein
LPPEVRQSCDVVEVHNPFRALVKMTREPFQGLYVSSEFFNPAMRLGRLL